MIISDFLRVSGQTENSVLPSVLAVTVPCDIRVKVIGNPLGRFQLCTLHTSSYERPLLAPESSICHKLPPYAKIPSTTVTLLLSPNSVLHNPTEYDSLGDAYKDSNGAVFLSKSK